MMLDADTRRWFFAEELEAQANLRSPALVEALASVPRERYLPPGPWLIRSTEFGFGPRMTADDDPRRVCHNVAVAIDPSRELYNGFPTTVASFIDVLDLHPGDRVLHVGCGLGYYTALMARCVGESGRVVAVEIDTDLA